MDVFALSKGPALNKLELSGWPLEAIGIIGFMLLIGLPLYCFNQLPDNTPRHYGADGRPARCVQRKRREA
jgi:uncharacterized membrane protein